MTTTAPADDESVVSKVPGQRSETWMAVLATAAAGLGVLMGMGLLAWRQVGDGMIILTPQKALLVILVVIGSTLATLVAHEALHGLGMLACRARPRFGAGVMAPGMPYLYTTSEGHLFTRWQYLAVAALPNVAINLLLLGLIVTGPHRVWWVVPFAVHLSGGVGDAWLCWAVLAEPRGTLVEDQRGGIRVHRPGARPRTR